MLHFAYFKICRTVFDLSKLNPHLQTKIYYYQTVSVDTAIVFSFMMEEKLHIFICIVLRVKRI